MQNCVLGLRTWETSNGCHEVPFARAFRGFRKTFGLQWVVGIAQTASGATAPGFEREPDRPNAEVRFLGTGLETLAFEIATASVNS